VIRAVLDTNVLVSGLAGLDTWTSTPGIILSRWLDGAFELLISPVILAELDRTLDKPYYRSQRSLPHIVRAERAVRALSTGVVPTVVVSGIAPHPADDLVLAAAVSAQADYLVTGDRRFQAVGTYEGVTILSPRAFLDLLEMGVDEP
jgi:putative PIN family toxin of toxin-antitoxin system